MRKSLMTFAIIVLLCLFIMPVAPLICNADDTATYYIAEEDTILYNYELEPICIIPATYYLLKDGEGLDEYYNVIYSGRSGRVLKSKTSDEATMEIDNPYYESYLLMADSSDYILAHSAPSSQAKEKLYYDEPSMAFKYIGYIEDSENEEVWYYVSYPSNDDNSGYQSNDDKYGYLLSTDTNNPTLHTAIPEHPLSSPLEEEPTAPISPTTPTPEEPTNNLLRVLLILGITIPAIIVIFLLFKPSTNKRRQRPHRQAPYDDYDDYYDDDYYYDDYRYSRRDYRRRR